MWHQGGDGAGTMLLWCHSNDLRGETPLTLAVAGRLTPTGWNFPSETEKGTNRLELVQFLLSSGADVNATMTVRHNDRFTALDIARIVGATEIAKRLKEHGGKETSPVP